MQPTVRAKENVNGWNIFFSILFAILLFSSIAIVSGAYNQFPRYVPILDIVLIILAIQRLTRLLVYDKITRWLRELFVFKRELVGEDGSRWVELIPYGRGLRHTIHDLLDCPWCIGMWAALVIVFAYFIFPWAWYIIFMFAVSGASSFVQIVINGIGWRAEELKLEAKEKGHDIIHIQR